MQANEHAKTSTSVSLNKHVFAFAKHGNSAHGCFLSPPRAFSKKREVWTRMWGLGGTCWVRKNERSVEAGVGGNRAGRSRMSNLGRRVGRWGNKIRLECVQSSLFSLLFHTHCLALKTTQTHTHPHDSLPSSSSLFHLSYSNLKLIFSHSYLPKPTHISPPVSLHFLLSTTEKCDQRRNPFEIKYESS